MINQWFHVQTALVELLEKLLKKYGEFVEYRKTMDCERESAMTEKLLKSYNLLRPAESGRETANHRITEREQELSSLNTQIEEMEDLLEICLSIIGLLKTQSSELSVYIRKDKFE